MEEAAEALRKGECVAILDGEAREAETDLFYPAICMTAEAMRRLRNEAGGELYIAVGREVAAAFGLPFMGQILGRCLAFPSLNCLQKSASGMCQGSCSVSISLDHRSLKTGAPDSERSFTCRRLAQLFLEVSSKELPPLDAQILLGKEFHSPGHIFLCLENEGGLTHRSGHTELSIALARLAGVPPLMVGCVMLNKTGDDYGALAPQDARSWALANNTPCLRGDLLINHLS